MRQRSPAVPLSCFSIAIAALALATGTAGGIQVAQGAAPQPSAADTSPFADATGRELMDAVYERHRPYPHVFEEQSMVLIDRNGNRETRQLRRYSQVDEDGSIRFLLLFDTPREVEGVALLGTRTPEGHVRRRIYLPALGGALVETGGSFENGDSLSSQDDLVLGTDFSISDLTGEELDRYRYIRRRNIRLDDVPYYVVDAFDPADDSATERPRHRHYILQDGLYITRTDHFDDLGRLRKRHTHHDLKVVDGDTWRANMMLMINYAARHRTLIKIDRRIFSRDYVPEEVFSVEWLFRNAPPLVPQEGEEEPEDGGADRDSAVTQLTGGGG